MAGHWRGSPEFQERLESGVRHRVGFGVSVQGQHWDCPAAAPLTRGLSAPKAARAGGDGRAGEPGGGR